MQQMSPQQQENMKRLSMRQQQQVMVPSSSNDTSQSTPSYQNLDELINNSVGPPNVNINLQVSATFLPKSGVMNQ